MSSEECRRELQKLKDELVDNLAIFHERVTLLVELIQFDIGESRVSFKARIIKPLNRERTERNNLYHYMISKDEISFGSSYRTQPSGITLIKDKKVGRGVSPFNLWLDPELALFALKNDDSITKLIPRYILWSEDWTVLKTK